MKNLEEFICLIDSYGMTLMPVLFSDCTVAKQFYKERPLGPQPEPEIGYFGGSSSNSFDVDTQSGESIGYNVTDDPEMEPIVEKYVRELAQVYGQDDRVIIWNIWNELGNSGRNDMSLPMARKIIGWLREEDVKQPLTIEMWGAQTDGKNYFQWLHHPKFYGNVDKECIELSDIVSFHFYGDYPHARQMIQFLRQFNRPLINTEWMHRPFNSLIQTHLPLWKKEKIGSYFFGLVNGKTQFNIVWDFVKNYPIDTSLWMHDLYHADFTPYDKEELDVIRACNEDKNIWKDR